jgi:uncharacterized delta-60 repeat protein
MVVLPDDRVIMAGYSSDGPLRNSRFPTLERMLSNGMPDPSFGVSGVIVFPFTGEFESVARQPDGKILVAGSAFGRGDRSSRYILARFNDDGSFDTSFAGTGLIIGPFDRSARFTQGDEVLLRPDGRIVLAGSSKRTVENFAVSQFNGDGTRDTTFGVLGTTIIPGTRHVESAVLQPDGKIVLAGMSNFTLARLLPNGSLDTTFGSGGITFRIFWDYCEVKNIKLQPDGKILAEGWAVSIILNQKAYVVTRYNADGTFDQNFEQVIIDGPADELGGDLILLPNGKFFHIDTITIGEGTVIRYKILRLNANGSLDESWFTNGGSGIPLPFSILKAGVAARLQRGKIVIAGGALPTAHTAIRFGLSERASTPLFDFDGDGKTDISVYRPSSNTNWILLRSSLGALYTHWGTPTDVAVPADYDGDGKTDIAIYRNGRWEIQNRYWEPIQMGSAGDIPRPGDFDGDGEADRAIWQPSTGIWRWRSSVAHNPFMAALGAAGDIPVIADMDGDGVTDPAVFRPSDGNWYWLTLPDGQYHSAHFGTKDDIPVVADYDGDGSTDLSVFRPSTSYWIRLNSSNGQYFAQKFGTTGDIPVAGDYDGDGKYDLAVYRPSSGVWYLLNSSTGLTATQFGTAVDKPIPSVFLP